MKDNRRVPPPARRWMMAALLLSGLPLSPVLQAKADNKPLPELNAFMQEVKQKLLQQRSDRELLQDYTYRKKVVVEDLKKDSTVKKTDTMEYEVYHFSDGPYLKLLSKNGVPLAQKELKKQDDVYRDKMRKRRESEAKLTPRERQAKLDEKRKERQEQIDDVVAAFQFKMIGRETLDDRPAIVVGLTPRPAAKLKTRAGNMVMKKVAGKIWIAEDELQLMKLEIEALDNMTLGGGLLAKVDKGTEIHRQWRKVNDEVWLPVRGETHFKAKVMMFKGFHFRRLEEYWDYKRFSVSTAISFPD